MDPTFPSLAPVIFDPISNELILNVYVQPKASRDQIVGEYNNELKIAITAPPVDGKANQHLVKYLSKLFQVAKTNIIIEKGELGRHKQIKIPQPKIIPEQIQQLINNL